ncbi:MAG: peptide ABC transporter substrate-binding protein [Gammaproteobacteria bacterium]
MRARVTNRLRLVFVAGAATLLGACSAPDPGRTIPVGGASGTELAAEQILNKNNGAEPQTLDPHRAEGVPASNILRDLFEGLVSEAPDGSLIPGAAETWQINDDGTVYTFTLRADGRWSNGDPVTAADFAYGIQRSVDPATLSQYSSILFPIVNAEQIVKGELSPEQLGVTALDDRTLEIRLIGPTPYFLGLLTHSTTYAVHRPSVEKFGNRFARAGQLVGNGAYRLDEWVVQSHIRLLRSEKYWDDENTVIDEVNYFPIENQDAMLKRYRADELDFTQDLPFKQIAWIRENIADQLYISPYLGSYYYSLNLTLPPFAGAPKLRRALALAIDRDVLTEKITGSGEIPAYSWTPRVTGYTQQPPDWAGWTQERRNTEARRLFKESGHSEANPLTIQILYNTSENHKRIAVAIASMWKQVLGVETKLLNQEWKVFLETRKQKTMPGVARNGWIGDYNDAYSFTQLLASDNEQNDSGFANDEYDALLDRAAVEPDMQKRAELMEAAERLMLEEQPIIPIYFYVSKHLIKPWVGGFEPNIMDHHYTKNFHILKH